LTRWEVVGADALGAVAGADHGFALRRDFCVLLGVGLIEEAGAEDLQRARFVLMLRFLIAADDHHPAGDVGDADRRVCRVDALAAGTRGAHHIDAEIFFLVDVDLDLVGFRHHHDGDRRGVNPAGGFGRGHPLHAMHSAFVLEAGIGALAVDAGDDFFDAAEAGIRQAERFNLPSMAFGVAAVEPEQFGREERGLGAAGPGANFQDDVFFVERITRKKQNF
jgi:hypothetical protein